MATIKTNKTTTKKDKEKAIDLKPVENQLLSENPLMQSMAIAPIDELDEKVDLINEIESLAELSKQQLLVKRQRIELEVDDKKLDIAKKTISTIEKIIQAVADETVLARVAKNINTPQDMKYMAEAAEKLTGTLRNLMNPNVVDEYGGRKRTKIFAQFQTQSGERASIGVELDNG